MLTIRAKYSSITLEPGEELMKFNSHKQLASHLPTRRGAKEEMKSFAEKLSGNVSFKTESKGFLYSLGVLFRSAVRSYRHT